MPVSMHRHEVVGGIYAGEEKLKEFLQGNEAVAFLSPRVVGQRRTDRLPTSGIANCRRPPEPRPSYVYMLAR
jgi:hypothetical protein